MSKKMTSNSMTTMMISKIEPSDYAYFRYMFVIDDHKLKSSSKSGTTSFSFFFFVIDVFFFFFFFFDITFASFSPEPKKLYFVSPPLSPIKNYMSYTFS